MELLAAWTSNQLGPEKTLGFRMVLIYGAQNQTCLFEGQAKTNCLHETCCRCIFEGSDRSKAICKKLSCVLRRSSNCWRRCIDQAPKAGDGELVGLLRDAIRGLGRNTSFLHNIIVYSVVFKSYFFEVLFGLSKSS